VPAEWINFVCGLAAACPYGRNTTKNALCLRVWHHAPNSAFVGLVHNGGLTKVHFALGAFFGQDVAQVLLAPAEFAGASGAEALGGGTPSFHLGHSVLLLPNYPGKCPGVLNKQPLPKPGKGPLSAAATEVSSPARKREQHSAPKRKNLQVFFGEQCPKFYRFERYVWKNRRFFNQTEPLDRCVSGLCRQR
jgi:hypothetical protein